MGHGRRIRLGLGLAAAAALAQDPAALLEKTRDRVLAEAPNLSRYVCTETLERSYYSRRQPPEDPPSCERILVDRKRNRYELKLDAVDRLRLRVSVHQGREIYAWTGTAPYEHGVEDILQSGPIVTGVFANHLVDVFSNPAVRFRLLGERADAVEFGFRVPVEASRYVVGSHVGWLPTGYGGSLHIDKDSLEVRRFQVETDELPPETEVCQQSTDLEFAARQTAGASWFLPIRNRTHDILRDATETDSVVTLSDCGLESGEPAVPPAARTGAPLAPGLRVKLAFAEAIDTETAAGGDEISAQVYQEFEAQVNGKQRLIPRGTKVTGRILEMRRQLNPAGLYLLRVAFETIEIDSAAVPFYARLLHESANEKLLVHPMTLTGHGWKNWPQGLFGFDDRRARLVIRAGTQSEWLTVTTPEGAQ